MPQQPQFINLGQFQQLAVLLQKRRILRLEGVFPLAPHLVAVEPEA